MLGLVRGGCGNRQLLSNLSVRLGNSRMNTYKPDKADLLFSQWIRLRDRECVRCFSPVFFNAKGQPKSHQNSHYFGRTKQNTRFDPDNCDTLCHGCHRLWEKEDREDYREFKLNQLGQEGFDALVLRSRLYHKKDYLSERIYWRERLKADYGRTSRAKIDPTDKKVQQTFSKLRKEATNLQESTDET